MQSSHTCPKCQSDDILCNASQPSLGERSSIGITSLKWFYVDVYLCMSCGYVEEYMRKENLEDEKIKEKLRSVWARP